MQFSIAQTVRAGAVLLNHFILSSRLETVPGFQWRGRIPIRQR